METIVHGSIFEGSISIFEPEEKAGIRQPIKFNDLLLSAHNFYHSLLKNELKILKSIDIPARLKTKKELLNNLGRTTFLIRLGRHSGAEAVTIEGNRYIKIQQGKKPAKFSTQGAETIWLAAETSKPVNNTGLIPLGWAVLEKC